MRASVRYADILFPRRHSDAAVNALVCDTRLKIE